MSHITRQLSRQVASQASSSNASRSPSHFAVQAQENMKRHSVKIVKASPMSFNGDLSTHQSFSASLAAYKKNEQSKANFPTEHIAKTPPPEKANLKLATIASQPNLLGQKSARSENKTPSTKGSRDDLKRYLISSHKTSGTPKGTTFNSFRFSADSLMDETPLDKTNTDKLLDLKNDNDYTCNQSTFSPGTGQTGGAAAGKQRNKSSFSGNNSKGKSPKTAKNSGKYLVTTDWDFQGEEGQQKLLRSSSFTGQSFTAQIKASQEKEGSISPNKTTIMDAFPSSKRIEVEELREKHDQDKKIIKDLQEQISRLRARFEGFATPKSAQDNYGLTSNDSLELKEFTPISSALAFIYQETSPQSNGADISKASNKTLIATIENLKIENKILKQSSQAANQYKEAAKRYRDMAREKEEECSRLAAQLAECKARLGLPSDYFGSARPGETMSDLVPEPEKMTVRPCS